MRKLVPSLVVIFLCIEFGYSQKTVPLIIQGKIDNYAENELLFYYEDSKYVQYVDTMHLKEDGSFFLKIKDIKKAQIARISQKSGSRVIDNLFVAPGYNLTIYANGVDYKTLHATKRITGYGSESNLYNVIIDSIFISRTEDTIVYYKKFPRALAQINSEIHLRDSIADMVFADNRIKDKYSAVFYNTIKIDNGFLKLSILLGYFEIQGYPIESRMKIIRENIDADLVNHISDGQNLVSNSFKFIIADAYLRYLLDGDEYNNPSSDKKSGYRLSYGLKKVDVVYTGDVRDYAFYRVMSSFMKSLKDIASYTKSKSLIDEYIPKISNKYYQESLKLLLGQREKALISTAMNSDAPAFSLEDSKGSIHNLSDLKGKVVYLDFWATWCGPCLKEMPALNDLYQKYKVDERVEIISISVSDSKESWEKKIKKDKFEWLQLIDKDNQVLNSYLTNAIPRYVLIDKAGKIVSFDAPRPSSKNELAEMIDGELKK